MYTAAGVRLASAAVVGGFASEEGFDAGQRLLFSHALAASVQLLSSPNQVNVTNVTALTGATGGAGGGGRRLAGAGDNASNSSNSSNASNESASDASGPAMMLVVHYEISVTVEGITDPDEVIAAIAAQVHSS